MDDLISREAVMDIISDYYNDPDTTRHEEEIMENMMERVEQLSGITIPITEPKWIPCSEKLPTVSGWYLCTVGAHVRNPRLMCYDPSKWHSENRSTWRDTEGTYVYDWFVKAWKPLPKPWEGESK